MSSKKHKRLPAHELEENTHTTKEAPAESSATVAKKSEHDQEITSVGSALTRIAWLFVGPVALCLLLFGIANTGSGWATVLDLVYFVVFGLTIFCRWSEQRSGKAMTAYGDEPSTWGHFRRYVKVIVPVGMAAWIVANAIGNHFLGWITGGGQP